MATSLGKAFDEFYWYDGIHRLKDLQRGTLNAGKSGITPGTSTFAECWGLDTTGNWSNYRQDDDGNGTWDLIQNRTNNAVNEITNITESAGPSWITPAYDAAGNMTTIPKPANPTAGYIGIYDPWNRLTAIKEGGDFVAEYAFDPAKRRTIQKSYSSGVLSETRHLYYTEPWVWQIVEERVDSSANPERQYVWGVRYIDDLVLRDRDTDGNGSLDERLYGLQDANWNVTGITSSSGTVQERLSYSAYGAWTIYSAGYDIRSSSAFMWTIGFTAAVHDPNLGWLVIRHRIFDQYLGVWIQRDAVFSYAEINGYRYADNMPLILVDPTGLDPIYFYFAAFISRDRGDWLDEPGGYKYEFHTDDRREGEPGSSRIASFGQIDSCDIGTANPSGFTIVGASRRRNKKTLVEDPPRTAPLDVDKVYCDHDGRCTSWIRFYASASYPFVLFAPNIDYVVSFKFVASANQVTVSLTGYHDAFPDYDSYVNGLQLYFRKSPDAGPTPLNLGGYYFVYPYGSVTLNIRTPRCCRGTCP